MKALKNHSIWSPKVVTIFSIFGLPVTGAFLAMMNYKSMGKTKRGIIFFLEILGIVVVLNHVFYFLNQDEGFNGFVVAIIAVIFIYFDQNKMYFEWKKMYPDENTRPWWSALGATVIVGIVIGGAIYLIG